MPLSMPHPASKELCMHFPTTQRYCINGQAFVNSYGNGGQVMASPMEARRDVTPEEKH